ncbi:MULTISPECIES: ParA family protein [Rhodococcus erythropolis group]|jgi:chromosome partitioning protein|uniref:CobQ/CobB/MinD/ParA nucleotide binding domain protein n=1 Tax=Rhodococcus erythropolis TaxID=1833 RepID=A0A6G9D4G3_RHOER|nr:MULTISPECIES: ParA family protein [Rhodococcus erythropolis group]MCT6736619.1 ParA family protein [Rhodococcus qingshengii]MDJ0434985.1 ParA family protein [Rhodococcus qingshengii]MDJ0491116.1 ParA family protein [Rhodococcus qingshengii]QIP43950.1 CobQ/CobB/MinD/ParA nucleotide binding domain protein [Rhodococcus erythropolis]QOS66601.1 ParA family protein [Rhodococcus qingshengii]
MSVEAVPTTPTHQQLPACFGFFNGKGGVGKTSLCANTGGLLAAGGYRVLLLDFDPQANLCRDLGFVKDDGVPLFSALLSGSAPPIIQNVGGRENLDIVPGGPAMFDLAAVMVSRQQRQGGKRLGQLLLAMLLQVAADYDVIIFDTPPTDLTIIEAVMEVVHAVVIPIRADDASLDGMETIAGQFSAARDGDPERNLPAVNPHLQLGGICLFGVSSRATKLDATIREAVEEMIGDSAPTFESRIRTMETTAFDARRQGLLVHELEERSAGETASRIAALRKGTKPKDLMLSRNASGLAEDYSNLTREILVRMSTITAERASA